MDIIPQIAQADSFLAQSTSAVAPPATLETKSPGLLSFARFVPPSTIDLEFADGLKKLLEISMLGMPLDRILWQTIKASTSGDMAIVKGTKEDSIPIDSATLRYLVDSDYAAKVDQSLESLQLSRDELAGMAKDSPPPQWWYASPSEDLTRESWK